MMLPAAVCSMESLNLSRPPTNCTVIAPAPVSTCALCPTLNNSTVPPPVITRTDPWALASRTLPPPVSAITDPNTSPSVRLPPPEFACRSPLHLLTSMLPPPVSTDVPPELPMRTLPPPVFTMSCPLTRSTDTLPPPLCRYRSDPTLPASKTPPPLLTFTGPATSSSFTSPPPVTPTRLPLMELNASDPPRVSTLTTWVSRGICTVISAVRRFSFRFVNLPSRTTVSPGLLAEKRNCSNCRRAASSDPARERLRITYDTCVPLPCTCTEPMSVKARNSRPAGKLPVVSSTHALPSRNTRVDCAHRGTAAAITSVVAISKAEVLHWRLAAASN